MKEKIIEQIYKLGKDYKYDGIERNNYFTFEWGELEDSISQALDEYADWKIKECLPKKMPGYFDVNDYEEGCTTGFNRCIDQILSNKDKK